MVSGLFVADQGQGPTVLTIHGQPGQAGDWDSVATRLVDDHRVLVPDRPGYGRTGGGAVDMAANAEILADLLVEKGVAPATVVGHSYGGGIAILLAVHRPEVVSGLVLVGSVGRADSLNTVDHVLALPWAGEVLAAAGMVAFGRVMPRVRGLVTHLPGQRLAWLEASLPDRGYRDNASGSARQVRHSFVFEQRSLVREIADVETALPRVGVPTVVIAGTWDVVVPPSVATTIAAEIAGAELVTVARTGHFVPRDAPHAVVSAVRRVEARATDPPVPEDNAEGTGV
jgi:pimeloyl-ACP methyl ester carboxylesterase